MVTEKNLKITKEKPDMHIPNKNELCDLLSNNNSQFKKYIIHVNIENLYNKLPLQRLLFPKIVTNVWSMGHCEYSNLKLVMRDLMELLVV